MQRSLHIFNDRALPIGVAYSLQGLLSQTCATCRIRRLSDRADREFTGAGVARGEVSKWLAGSKGRVVVLFDQAGNGRHACAKDGAYYSEHPERGPCLRFPGEPAQVYAVTTGDTELHQELTIIHYSRTESSHTMASTTLLGCRDYNRSIGQYVWRLGEDTRDGRIVTDIGGILTRSDKPNGWWRIPMLYVSRLGPTITHWIGNYAFDQHAGTTIAAPSLGRLCLGGSANDPDTLFAGDLFDLVICPGRLDDAACEAAVDALCRQRMRHFPFLERVTHLGRAIEHPATQGVDGTNHPTVVKQNDSYYLFWNSDISGATRGIHVATSPDLRMWTQRGRMLGPGPEGSFDSKGYPYLWPGDIWRDPHTGTFWKLQSYGVTVRAGYANGHGRAGWTYADSLAGPWYWVPRHMEYLAPERTGDKRAIEVSFFTEQDDLHIFSANDSDDVGYRDSVQHWLSRGMAVTKNESDRRASIRVECP